MADARKDKMGPRWSQWVTRTVHRLVCDVLRYHFVRHYLQATFNAQVDEGILDTADANDNITFTPDAKKTCVCPSPLTVSFAKLFLALLPFAVNPWGPVLFPQTISNTRYGRTSPADSPPLVSSAQGGSLTPPTTLTGTVRTAERGRGAPESRCRV